MRDWQSKGRGFESPQLHDFPAMTSCTANCGAPSLRGGAGWRHHAVRDRRALEWHARRANQVRGRVPAAPESV